MLPLSPISKRDDVVVGILLPPLFITVTTPLAVVTLLAPGLSTFHLGLYEGSCYDIRVRAFDRMALVDGIFEGRACYVPWGFYIGSIALYF